MMTPGSRYGCPAQSAALNSMFAVSWATAGHTRDEAQRGLAVLVTPDAIGACPVLELQALIGRGALGQAMATMAAELGEYPGEKCLARCGETDHPVTVAEEALALEVIETEVEVAAVAQAGYGHRRKRRPPAVVGGLRRAHRVAEEHVPVGGRQRVRDPEGDFHLPGRILRMQLGHAHALRGERVEQRGGELVRQRPGVGAVAGAAVGAGDGESRRVGLAEEPLELVGHAHGRSRWSGPPVPSCA